MWSNRTAPHFTQLHVYSNAHLPGLQAVDPHELERWRDATFVMSKRVRHLDNLGSLQTSTWDYERFTI
jgi:hypothetical protein